MKKTWEAPKLIVLVRSRPEESLTMSCKGGDNPQGPNGAASMCVAGVEACNPCLQYAAS